MEDTMVKDIDNSTSLEPEEALALITDLFNQFLPYFSYDRTINQGKYKGFMSKYNWENVVLYVGGERGGLDYKIFIKGYQVSILEFDDRLTRLYSGSESNYYIFFEILRDFLNEYNYG